MLLVPGFPLLGPDSPVGHSRAPFPVSLESLQEVFVKKIFVSALAAAAALLPAAARSANSAMPAVGQSAPAFTLPSQDGTPVSLASYRGKWVVLYFYPRDMTPGCTIEAHNFQGALSQFSARNAVILGVSVDSTASHQQFCAKDGLTFHLLSDAKHAVVSAYGSLGGFGGVAMANRNTFLIDPQGKIAKVWTQVNPQTAASDVLAAIPPPAMQARPAATMNSVKPPATTPNSLKPPQ
jgi:peroxiredoxin Q/BCP